MKIARLPALLLASMVSAMCVASTVQPFPNRVEYVEIEPLTLSAADVDVDGHLDLVMATAGYGLAAILYGRGDGTFDPAVDLGVNWSYAAHVEDVNGDTLPDVIVWNEYTDEPRLFVNQGGRSFAESTAVGGNQPYWMLSADLDEDGNPDLVISDDILFGHGDGTFLSPITVVGRPIAIGDFTRSGHLDYVTLSTSMTLYAGNGDGTFATSGTDVPVTSEGLFARNTVMPCDLDNDGIPDLAIGGASGVEVLPGASGGGFQPSVTYGSPGGPLEELLIVDLDLDGNDDVVATRCDAPELYVYRGNGDGTLAPAVIVARSAWGYCSMTAGDFDGDGRPDVAVATHPGNIQLLFSSVDGTLVPPSPLATFDALDPPSGGLALADFNQDGNLDVASHGSGPSRLSINTGNGDGTLQAYSVVDLPAMPSAIEAGDLDGDGLDDIVLTQEAIDAVALVFGNGNGTFDVPVTAFAGKSPIGLVVGDFDGDTDPDLVTLSNAAPTPSIVFMRNTGSRVFVAQNSEELGSEPTGIAAGMLDGDAHLDVAVAQTSVDDVGTDDIVVFFGRGDGSFDPPTIIPFDGVSWEPWNLTVHPWGVAIGDVDDDGLGDLVVASIPGVYVLKGLPGRQFGEPVLAIGGRAESVRIIDLDGDSNLDVVIENHLLGYARGHGDGTFAAPVFSAAGSLRKFALGDLDGDGRTDAAVGAYPDLHVLRNRLPDRLRFDADRSTISWSSLVDTVLYTVYRGALSELVDADLDGLPDTGYGTCVNAIDPDPTDTVFIDPTQPAAGQGLFYVRARVTAQGESGLGVTAAGQVRWVAQPCP